MRKYLNRKLLFSLVELAVGAVIAAFALEGFLVPNDIFDGGVVGIAMIVSRLVGAPLGVLTVLINLPFVAFGLMRLGRMLVAKFSFSLVVFSAMTMVFEHLEPVTDEIVLAVTFGGFLLGVGVGLMLRAGGCVDGTEIFAIWVNRTRGIGVGKVVLGFNVVIYLVAGLIFGVDRGMWSLLMYFITSRIIDIVEVGWDTAKSVMIVSDDGTQLAQRIYEELGRTVTFMRGEGLVSGTSKDVVFCVVTRAEIFDLKKILDEVPGSTFTTITDVNEVVGNHMKSTNQSGS